MAEQFWGLTTTQPRFEKQAVTAMSVTTYLWLCGNSAGLVNRDLPLVGFREGNSSGVIWTGKMTNRSLKTTSTVPNFQLCGPETSWMAIQVFTPPANGSWIG